MDIEQPKKPMWRWFKWVLLGIGILIVVAITIILILKPTEEELAKIPIPAYSDPICQRTFTPLLSSEPYYQGPLFDTHYHIPPDHKNIFVREDFPLLEKELRIKDMVCELEKEKVIGTIAFYAPSSMLMFSTRSDNQIYQGWADQAKDVVKGLPEWFHVLYDPILGKKEEAEQIFANTPNSFEGFGELVYYSDGSPRPNAEVDDEISQATLGYANQHKLVVMVHPDEKDKDRLENALRKNPNAIFILHGWGHDDYVMDLMDQYPNFYFTIDATTIFREANRYVSGNGEKFTAQVKKDFTEDLNRTVDQWNKQIKRHPDRYLWGTDRCYRYQYSEELGKLYEEQARAFLGRIDSAYQEMVAYKNADDIFTKGLQPQIKTQGNNQEGSLNDLPESAKECVINHITQVKWNEILSHQRPATSEEQQVIEQCSRE